ncbi:hypothetical protein WA538_005934, partial [Blastocystis sp. DL]
MTAWLFVYEGRFTEMRETNAAEKSLLESVLSSLAVTPHLFLSAHMDRFVDCIREILMDFSDNHGLCVLAISCVSRFLQVESGEAFLQKICPVIQQYLPMIAGAVFPNKETIARLVALLASREHDPKWACWLLQETCSSSASYDRCCESCIQELSRTSSQMSLEDLWTASRAFFSQYVTREMNVDRYHFFARSFLHLLEMCDGEDTSTRQTLRTDWEEAKRVMLQTHQESAALPTVESIIQK